MTKFIVLPIISLICFNTLFAQQQKHSFTAEIGLISNHSNFVKALNEAILPLRPYSNNLSHMNAFPGISRQFGIGYKRQMKRNFFVGINLQLLNINYLRTNVATTFFGASYTQDKADLRVMRIGLIFEKRVPLNEHSALRFLLSPSLIHIDGGSLFLWRRVGYAPETSYPFIMEQARLNTTKGFAFAINPRISYDIPVSPSKTISIFLEAMLMFNRYLIWEYRAQDTSSEFLNQVYTTQSAPQRLHTLSFGISYSFWPEKWIKKK